MTAAQWLTAALYAAVFVVWGAAAFLIVGAL